MKNIIYYSAAWCAPCKLKKPMVKRIADQLGVPFDLEQDVVDVDTPGIGIPHDVKGVPTVIIRDGMTTVAILTPDMVTPINLRKALA